MSNILDSIFSSVDIPEKVIDVPEWGVRILARGLTLAEHAKVRAVNGTGAAPTEEEIAIRALIEGAYDPETRLKLFQAAHRDQLYRKSPIVLSRIAQQIMELTGATPQSLEAAEKNSQEASSDSASSSPGNSAVQ